MTQQGIPVVHDGEDVKAQMISFEVMPPWVEFLIFGKESTRIIQ